MTEQVVDRLKRMKEEFEGLNRTFTTTNVVKIDLTQIKKELAEEFKREMLGRSSQGGGM
jgi:hypothetical protein